jgi:hypothetical protein
MKNVIKTLVALIFISFFQDMPMHAQTKYSPYEFGLGAGQFIYQGDLVPTPAGSYNTLRHGFTAFGSKIIGPSFSIRANFAFGKIAGDDAKFSLPAWRKERNFNFTTPVVEATALLVWNVLGKNNDGYGFAPYVFGGAGLSYLNIKRSAANFNTAFFSEEPAVIAGLEADLAHRLPRLTPVLPVGAGIRYAVNRQLSIYAESSYRLMFTDYLDGFSQAANANKNDHYYTNSIGVIYRLAGKNTLKCPVIKY